MSRKIEVSVYGKHPVLDGLRGGMRFKSLLISKSLRRSELEQFRGYSYSLVDRSELDRLVRANHQGVVGRIEVEVEGGIEGLLRRRPERVLILDGITDPQNFGAILRNANAFGFLDVIFPEHNSAKVTGSVLRVSSGGYVGIRFYQVRSLVQCVLSLRTAGYWVYASSPNSGALSLEESTINQPTVLVLGSEGKGVRRSVIMHSNMAIKISHSTKSVSSLNVASASAILLYWFDRRLGEGGVGAR